jgi:hypothetical protein
MVTGDIISHYIIIIVVVVVVVVIIIIIIIISWGWLRIGRPVFNFRQGEEFSLRHSVQTGYGSHEASQPGITGRSAKVKNLWSYTSIRYTHLRGMCVGTGTLLLLLLLLLPVTKTKILVSFCWTYLGSSRFCLHRNIGIRFSDTFQTL